MKTKTGICYVENLNGVNVGIPCDATVNMDASFNTPLIARLGETMYFVEPRWNFDFENPDKPVPTLVDEDSIHEVIVTKISHSTGCELVIYGIVISSPTVCHGGPQNLFFETYEEALKAVNAVNQFYENNKPSKNWEDDWNACVTPPKYRYMLKFPVKPQDILLEDDKHYVANRVIAGIESGITSVRYQGYEPYKNVKEVQTMHEYSGVVNQYAIVKLI